MSDAHAYFNAGPASCLAVSTWCAPLLSGRASKGLAAVQGSQIVASVRQGKLKGKISRSDSLVCQKPLPALLSRELALHGPRTAPAPRAAGVPARAQIIDTHRPVIDIAGRPPEAVQTPGRGGQRWWGGPGSPPKAGGSVPEAVPAVPGPHAGVPNFAGSFATSPKRFN